MQTPELRRRVEALEWYHTLELAPGVVTPGWFDTRSITGDVCLPTSLAGQRCLDIGTFDGFWAFEMDRRGAAEVVAIDVLDPAGWDWPAGSTDAVASALAARKGRGEGFLLAAEALASPVRRVERSVYDLDPAVDGEFGFVYLGSLLLHLRDPIGALERVRSVCNGELVLCDAIDPWLSRVWRGRPMASLDAVGRPWWWKPNEAALVGMVEAAGFEVVEGPKRLRMPRGKGQPRSLPRPRVLRSPAGRQAIRSAWRGDPHAALRAR
jgi:tRNA (mo5U34)-methyltransferase